MLDYIINKIQYQIEQQLLRTTDRGIRVNYLLMDGTELFSILEDRISLSEVLRRKKEKAAMRGNPFYKFKGEKISGCIIHQQYKPEHN